MSLEGIIRVEPVQARAKARVGAILKAALEHYSAVGRDQFDLEAVATLADCSVATIYRYFETPSTLLDAVAPDRERAEIKLAAIRSLQSMGGSDASKWLSTVHILQQP